MALAAGPLVVLFTLGLLSPALAGAPAARHP